MEDPYITSAIPNDVDIFTSLAPVAESVMEPSFIDSLADDHRKLATKWIRVCRESVT